VCGHYGCGGVEAALTHADFGVLNMWLRHIKDVAQAHAAELEAHERRDAVRRLVELNVIEQVHNLAQTSVVQRAWARAEQPLELHGWVYDVSDGLIRDLGVTLSSAETLEGYYRYDFDSG
jgi:carbonic anhydrase